MPSSNALNLPPRGVLVPSAAMDPRPGRYIRSPGRPRGSRGLGRDGGGRRDRGEECGLSLGREHIHRAKIKSWVAAGGVPGGDLFFSETDACVP